MTLLALSMFSYGQAKDMQKHLSLTQDLVSKGKHEEALNRFIWFHKHALEHEPSMYGVRLSFALSYWKNLGDIYPPALKALIKIRDENENLLQQGKGDKHLFHDVISINRTLDQSEKSIDLFERISKIDKKLTNECWGMIKDYILEIKRYDIAQRHIKDVTKEFVGVKEEYDSNVKLYKDPQIGGAEFKRYNENNFIDQVKKLVDLALALKDRKSAMFIRDSAIQVLDDERLKNLISSQ